MGSNTGIFSVKTAWEAIRKMEETTQIYDYIWLKGLPIQIGFFLGW